MASDSASFFERLVAFFYALILPPSAADFGCSANLTARPDPDKGPAMMDFLKHLEVYQAILLGIGSLLTALTVTIAGLGCAYIYQNISIEQRRNKLYFLVTLFPISMTFCLVGMLSPRAAALATSVGLLYFLLCLFVLVSLIRHLTEGRHELSRDLLLSGRPINFQSPPFCCCLPFLPEAQPTLRNLRTLEFIVLQAPIVRAIVLFVEATITVEIQRDAAYEMQLCELATLISILLAVFGVHTLARLVSDRLSQYGFMWMFRIVDIALLFFSGQHPIIFQNVLLRFHLIGCGPILTPPENARFICNFLIICELFALSLLGTFTLSPRRNRLFDLYKVESIGGHEDNESLTTTDGNTTRNHSSTSSTPPPAHPELLLFLNS